MSVARAVQRRKVQVKDGDAMSSKHHVEIQPAWALFSIFQTWITHEEVERQAVNTTKQEPERSDACSSNGAERGKCEWKMVLRAIKEVALKSHCCIGIYDQPRLNCISLCWWWGEECRTLNGVMIWRVVVEMGVFEKSTCRLVTETWEKMYRFILGRYLDVNCSRLRHGWMMNRISVERGRRGGLDSV